jgi:hypothetical protein
MALTQATNDMKTVFFSKKNTGHLPVFEIVMVTNLKNSKKL